MRPTHHFLRGRRAALATPGAAPLSGEIDFAFMSLVTALPQEQQVQQGTLRLLHRRDPSLRH